MSYILLFIMPLTQPWHTKSSTISC